MTTETQGRTRRTCGTCIYLIVTGMALLAIAWGLVDRAHPLLPPPSCSEGAL